MTIEASGRAALVLAAGLWIFATAPSQAADDANSTAASVAKYGSSHLKEAHRKSKTADAADSHESRAPRPAQLPTSVANAHAQLATDTPASKDAKAMSERASNIVQGAADNTAAPQPPADSPVVASDQLNDLDRALVSPSAQADATAPIEAQQAPPTNFPAANFPAATPAAASPAAANPPAVVVAASGSNTTWDQTSLIGKIFIGFGALLTVASAARMFIA
jgi:hypothetical protein